MTNNTAFSEADLEIIGALTEFRVASRAGALEKKLTIRTMDLDLKPRPYDAAEVKRRRDSLNVSQNVFARLLGVSLKTVRCWEQGDREPSTIARRCMDEVNPSPEHWRVRLGESFKSTGSSAARS